MRVNHGTWSHAGARNPHCAACAAGIGIEERELKTSSAKAKGRRLQQNAIRNRRIQSKDSSLEKKLCRRK
jgi:hypothetical protein